MIVGAGVRVVRLAGALAAGEAAAVEASGGLSVEAGFLVLPWRERRGQLPGTAVAWNDELWEVMDRGGTPGQASWRLEPWPDGAVARGVFALAPDALGRLVEQHNAEARRARLRRGVRWALPILGFAPAAIQRRIESELAVRAWRATAASALIEVMTGALGAIQLMSVSSGWWLPGWLHWLAYVGPFLAAEGMARFSLAVATAEPRGSLLLLPWTLWLERPRLAPRPAVKAPELARFDPDAGVLELRTVDLRPDWGAGGVLVYRGWHWRLTGLASHGTGWVYRFVAAGGGAGIGASTGTEGEAEMGVGEGAVGPALRLLAPVAAELPAVPTSGAVGTVAGGTIDLVLAALAPRAVQERWAAAHSTTAVRLTAWSGAFEVGGAFMNLFVRQLPSSPWTLLDLVLLGDGAVRLAVAVATRSGCGSVFTWPWRNGLERRLAHGLQPRE